MLADRAAAAADEKNKQYLYTEVKKSDSSS